MSANSGDRPVGRIGNARFAAQAAPRERRMCECGHHASWHKAFLPAGTAFGAGFGECKGYVGNVTTGTTPCGCLGFQPWEGPRDARTGEPVKPISLSTAEGSPVNSFTTNASDNPHYSRPTEGSRP